MKKIKFKFSFQKEHKHYLLITAAIFSLLAVGSAYLLGNYIFFKSLSSEGDKISHSYKKMGADPLVTKVPSLEDFMDGPIISSVDPSLGNPDAKVFLVQYSDFDCQFCQKQENVLKQALNKYGNKIKLIWKDYPNSEPDSLSYLASLSGRCAQMQGKFWEYHDSLYSRKNLNLDCLKEVAEEIKLNINQFEKCLANETARGLVNDNIEEANALDITGVPFIYVNKQEFMGEISLEDLEKAISEELGAIEKK